MNKGTIQSREQLLNRIYGWLNNVRLSTDEWANITDDDVNELHNLVDGLISLKCQKNPYGNFPIEFNLTDRTKYCSMDFCNVPYCHKAKNDDDRFDVLMTHRANLDVAFNNFNMAMKHCEMTRKQLI